MEEKNNQPIENEEAYQLTIVQKRLKTLGILFLLFFAAMTVRLFWIQIVKGDSYLIRAASQRQYTFQNSIPRGQIYDRNLIPFTDRKLSKFIAVTEYVEKKDETAALVAKAAGVSKKDVLSMIEETAGTFEIEAKDFNNPELNTIEKGMVKGVSVLEKKIRYTEDCLARHVIGYINKKDLVGMTGLEKSMNSILEQGGGERIVGIVDSHKSLIPSLGFRKITLSGKNDKFGLKLTLDFYMQKIVEDVLKRNNILGSAVIMEVKSGDILAMASTPDFDPNNVGSYLNNKNYELVNKAITPYDLGSIFKTVVAAAAIESKLVAEEDTFLCEGEIEVGNNVIKCSTYNTHKDREINLKEAFALSCNTAFIKVGTLVGAEKILEMANRMGFGEKLCSELLEEEAGVLPTKREDGIGNISIGQGRIQVTPLQVTSMMATIANNGIRNMPAIIESVVDDETGSVIEKMPRSKATVILNTSTTDQLKDMLWEVTKTGTAKQANLDEFGGSGGKTSSAETGMKNNETEIVHGWFAGFVPANKPLYAITVFVYDGKSGGKSAAPLFREIAEKIFTNYKPIK